MVTEFALPLGISDFLSITASTPGAFIQRNTVYQPLLKSKTAKRTQPCGNILKGERNGLYSLTFAGLSLCRINDTAPNVSKLAAVLAILH